MISLRDSGSHCDSQLAVRPWVATYRAVRDKSREACEYCACNGLSFAEGCVPWNVSSKTTQTPPQTFDDCHLEIARNAVPDVATLALCCVLYSDTVPVWLACFWGPLGMFFGAAGAAKAPTIGESRSAPTPSSKNASVQRGPSVRFHWGLKRTSETPITTVFNTWFLGRLESSVFWGLGGPGGSKRFSEMWGAKVFTFWRGFWGRRSRPDPQNR